MKKLVKLVPVMMAVLMILSLVSPVLAVTNPSSLTGTTTTSFDNVGKRIIGMVQAIGSIVSVLVLVILGIKYMMGSASLVRRELLESESQICKSFGACFDKPIAVARRIIERFCCGKR